MCSLVVLVLAGQLPAVVSGRTAVGAIFEGNVEQVVEYERAPLLDMARQPGADVLMHSVAGRLSDRS